VLGPATSLIASLIFVLILLVFARVIMSYVPAMAYSQAGRFLHSATDWILTPIQRIVPPMGGIDFSPAIAILLLYFIQGFIQSGNLVASIFGLVLSILSILILLLIIRVFFGFFRFDPWNPVVQMIMRSSEPFARPFRQWFPASHSQRYGGYARPGFDWAPVAALASLIVVYIGISYLRRFVY
jgi:YggT family protein